MTGGRKNETNRNPKRKFVKMKGKKKTKRNEKDAKKKKRTRVINNDGLWGWYGVYCFLMAHRLFEFAATAAAVVATAGLIGWPRTIVDRIQFT